MDQAHVVTRLKRPRKVLESDDRICIELVGKIRADAIFLFLITKATQSLSKFLPSTEEYKEEIKIS